LGVTLLDHALLAAAPIALLSRRQNGYGTAAAVPRVETLYGSFNIWMAAIS
jgi:hypothetical protein